MARYIRTSDGYIGKVENTKVYIKGEWFSIDDIKCFIIRQADTIEELIDGLIVEEKDNKAKWFFMEVGEFCAMSQEDKKYQSKDWDFYAFIKSDIGLIYAAKMNNEGDLKLIWLIGK